MPTVHEASCSCGQLRAVAVGDPVRVTVCHCLACQQRTGGPFGVNARFRADQVTTSGDSREYVRRSDDDEREARYFRFCPECGATVFYTYEGDAATTVIPVGAFADPSFPGPAREIHTDRAHPWMTVRLDG